MIESRPINFLNVVCVCENILFFLGYRCLVLCYYEVTGFIYIMFLLLFSLVIIWLLYCGRILFNVDCISVMSVWVSLIVES